LFTSGPLSGVKGVVGIFEHRSANVFALLKTEDRAVVHIELSQFFQTARIEEAHATSNELKDVLSSVMDAVWPVIGEAADSTEPKTFPLSNLDTPQNVVTEPLKPLSVKQRQALERKKKDTAKKEAAAAANLIFEPRVRKTTSTFAYDSVTVRATVKAKAAGVGATTRGGKQAKPKRKTSTCFNINYVKTLTINMHQRC